MIDFKELIHAYMDCRQDKRNRLAALGFEVDLEHNLVALYEDLVSDRYTISPSIAFVVDNPVKREVFAADFRDRIVHHLVMRRLMPLFERAFIFDSYSCRRGKGTLFGVRRVQRFIARCSKGYTQECYILKCDIQGFFMHIRRHQLWRMLESFITKNNPEERDLLLRLTEQIALHDPTVNCRINGSVDRWQGLPADKSLYGVNGKAMPGQKPRQLTLDFDAQQQTEQLGIPIGNLTSQWFGNFYLNGFDHYLKHDLGIHYYGRYVDDFVIVHPDKEFLKALIPQIRSYLKQELGLTLHPKKLYLQHYSKGVDFLGSKLRGGALLVGERVKAGAWNTLHAWGDKSSLRLLTPQEMTLFRSSMNSYLGIMAHHNSYTLRRKLLRGLSPQLSNRTRTPGCRKVVLQDYSTASGGEMVPYYEFQKLRKRKQRSKQLKQGIR